MAMSLSAKDKRILGDIARDLAAAEPRLVRALNTARLPGLLPRRALVTDGGRRHLGVGARVAAILASLLAGIALLTAGLVLRIPALVFAGAMMTQISSAVLGYVCARACRSRPARLRGR